MLWQKAQALRTGLLTLHTRALVRRIVLDRNRARAVLYHPDHGPTGKEHPADGVIVASAVLPVPEAHSTDLASIIVLRGLASLLGGCGFAVLYNSTNRTALAVGVLALLGNELRLSLQDAGAIQPVATFAGALLVGLLASAVRGRLHEPRMVLTVPGIIIMVPGSYVFQSVVLFNQGNALGGLQAGGAADEQRIAQGLAQAAQAMADRRLGHAEPLAGLGDAAVLHQRIEQPQQVQIDVSHGGKAYRVGGAGRRKSSPDSRRPEMPPQGIEGGRGAEALAGRRACSTDTRWHQG